MKTSEKKKRHHAKRTPQRGTREGRGLVKENKA